MKATSDPARRQRLLRGLIVGFASFFISFLVYWTGLVQEFELITQDLRSRIMAEPSASTDDVILVLVDQQSLNFARDEMGISAWPWPRELYSVIVDFCTRAKVKSVAFDLLLIDPSNFGVEDDQTLANSIEENGKFISAIFAGDSSGGMENWMEGVQEPGLQIEGLPKKRTEEFTFSHALFPLPEFSKASKHLAGVHFDSDSDGIYRRGRVFSFFDGKVIPSMALASYANGLEKTPELVWKNDSLLVGDMSVPLDEEGELLLKFTKSKGLHKAYSAIAVLQSELQLREGMEPSIPIQEFAGKYVLFGLSAPGLLDLRPSPVDNTTPGVEIHATMLDNLLSRQFLQKFGIYPSLLCILLFGLLPAFLATFATGVRRVIISYLIFIPLPFLLSLVLHKLGYSMHLVSSELAATLGLVVSSLANYATEGKQKRFIKGAFSQYLSPSVIDQLIRNPDRLQLGGEKRELTMFFSDLQGFTTISESLGPEELTQLLNDYLTAMVEIMQEEGGTIDKFEGDAIIAFWNAPIEQPDHAIRAVRATLRCQKKLAELRPVFFDRVGKELHMRVGLNTGFAVVGNMGSKNRFDYTMLGDSVNLAARLEGINKQFGTYTMISEFTRSKLDNSFGFRELSRVAVVGKKEPVRVYEVMFAEEAEARKELIQKFEEGLSKFYEGKFLTAESIFQTIADKDPAAAKYIIKCQALQKQYNQTKDSYPQTSEFDYGETPPPDWEGVWVMTEK